MRDVTSEAPQDAVHGRLARGWKSRRCAAGGRSGWPVGGKEGGRGVGVVGEGLEDKSQFEHRKHHGLEPMRQGSVMGGRHVQSQAR